MLVHYRVTPSLKFAGTHLYTWVERDTVRVKCLAQEHNTMSPARTRIRMDRSGDERTNHEATEPSQKQTMVDENYRKWLGNYHHQLLVKRRQSFSHLFSQVIIPV